MGFWSAIFGGSNPTLETGKKRAGQVSQFSIGEGEKMTTQVDNLISSLLSGDPSKTAQLLSPQISGVQQRSQQGKQALAQFGTRSGGTAAAAAGMDASTRGDINNMIASLTGSAIGAGSSIGKGLLDTGMEALDKEVKYSQQQLENWSNSILGQGVAYAVGGAEKAGMAQVGM